MNTLHVQRGVVCLLLLRAQTRLRVPQRVCTLREAVLQVA